MTFQRQTFCLACLVLYSAPCAAQKRIMSDYAQIKIYFPANFPELVVTSFYRPSGSHKTKRAVDITIKGLSSSTPAKDPRWYFYYAYTISFMSNLRSGTCRFAPPPICPHWHVQTGTDRQIGYEDLTHINGACAVDPTVKNPIHNYPYEKKDEFLAVFKEVYEKSDFGAGALGFFDDLSQSHAATYNPWRFTRVYTNNLISVDDLQSILDNVFGDGTIKSNVFDEVNHALGYENLDEALKPTEIIDMGKNLLFFGGFAWIAYKVAKELRYWSDDTGKKR